MAWSTHCVHLVCLCLSQSNLPRSSLTSGKEDLHERERERERERETETETETESEREGG